MQEIQPKVFVAENVSGLVKGTAKGYFKLILAALRACGYQVEARLLDAQWLGVPQARQRLIFVGIREDLGKAPMFPEPLAYRYTMRDVLVDKVRIVKMVGSEIVDDDTAPSIAGYSIHKKWLEIGRHGGSHPSRFNLVRNRWDSPSNTVVATKGASGDASVTHPSEPRKFSLRELRRICGFPDDFVLPGSYVNGWERLGRAVPPVMMSHVASTIRDRVLS